MSKVLSWSLSLALLGTAVLMMATKLSYASGNSSQTNSSVQELWSRFSAAVIKGDKTSVAALTRFPVGESALVSGLDRSAGSLLLAIN